MLICSICAQEGPHERHPDAKHWDWFTGYLKKRFVACPRCQQECPQEVNRAKEESQLKPIQKGAAHE